MTEARGGRRLFLTGALGASAVFLMGHSPYRRWNKYRALHAVIAADRGDAVSFALAERLAKRLEAHRPEWKPVAGRAESAATVVSLLKTRQLDLGLLRASDAYRAVQGADPDIALPGLRALAALMPGGAAQAQALLLVCRADYPDDRARAVAEALRGWDELAPAGTPLPVPLHEALGDRDTPT